MDANIEIKTNPPDLFRRMERFPQELARETEHTMEQALQHVWGSVPPYPPARPGSGYVRTGTLGRSLGSSQAGGMGSKPDIYQVRKLGASKYEGRFGTRLEYAPQVIGTQTQKRIFRNIGWWTMADIAKKATQGVQRLFDKMAGRMVKFLEGK